MSFRIYYECQGCGQYRESYKLNDSYWDTRLVGPQWSDAKDMLRQHAGKIMTQELAERLRKLVRSGNERDEAILAMFDAWCDIKHHRLLVSE